MSRIAKNSVIIPKETTCNFDNSILVAKGKMGELSINISPLFKVDLSEDKISVLPKNDKDKKNPIWGTTRALISNAVSGVSVGFTKDMEIVGVGYRGVLQGQTLSLSLGLSHPVEIEIPEGILVKMDGNTKFTISSADKQKLGEFAAMVRSKRPPEPFKGKGIRYDNEFILRKEGKKK